MTFRVPRHYDNTGLFYGGRRVIPGVGKSEPWMRHNALELLGLHGVREIAEMNPGSHVVVAAVMSSNMLEIRELQLREFGNPKRENECLLMIEKTHSLLRFKSVDAEGLPGELAAWFKSLKDKIIHRQVFVKELQSQAVDNEAAFRTFYHERLGGMAPEFYSRLHAWITLDSGRILYVGAAPYPEEKNDGVQTQFYAHVVGNAAHMSCMTRKVLHGMPGLYLAYFERPYIKVRNIIPAMEEDIPEEGDVESDPEFSSGSVLR